MILLTHKLNGCKEGFLFWGAFSWLILMRVRSWILAICVRGMMLRTQNICFSNVSEQLTAQTCLHFTTAEIASSHVAIQKHLMQMVAVSEAVLGGSVRTALASYMHGHRICRHDCGAGSKSSKRNEQGGKRMGRGKCLVRKGAGGMWNREGRVILEAPMCARILSPFLSPSLSLPLHDSVPDKWLVQIWEDTLR